MSDIMLLRWIRALFEKKRLRVAGFPGAQDAIMALRARGIRVTPGGGDFEHWRLGDFMMTDADLIQFAVNRGLIAG